MREGVVGQEGVPSPALLSLPGGFFPPLCLRAAFLSIPMPENQERGDLTAGGEVAGFSLSVPSGPWVRNGGGAYLFSWRAQKLLQNSVPVPPPQQTALEGGGSEEAWLQK